VARTVFDAIKEGNWNFELEESNKPSPATAALPGTREKLTILAARLREGLPLWNPEDRRTYDDSTAD